MSELAWHHRFPRLTHDPGPATPVPLCAPARQMIDHLPPLSLYVHLPWCVRKCPYCDFNSHPAGAAPPRDRYTSALLQDLKLEAARAAGRSISSVFIGGGTPSLFSGAEIATIIESVDTHLSLASSAEITMEANPGTIEYSNLDDYRRAGVNRLSIGAQSFDAGCLGRLGRIHGPAEITLACSGALAAGFNNINIDLMFGLPGQSLEVAMRDVAAAIALQPQHISYYELTLEPNTVFHHHPPPDLPDDELSWSIQRAGQAALQQAGYQQYEISAFARSGRECRHNLNYWQFGDYLAAGAGAHGKISDSSGRVRRYQKPAHPLTYMEQAECGRFEDRARQLADSEIAFEYMLNILRLPSGFSGADFSQRTGLPVAVIAERLARARGDGLMRQNSCGVWRPTHLGMRFLNDLQARFLPPGTVAPGKSGQDLGGKGAAL
jgi:putative oxygen-independent coproporphyrinogen III oxidase